MVGETDPPDAFMFACWLGLSVSAVMCSSVCYTTSFLCTLAAAVYIKSRVVAAVYR